MSAHRSNSDFHVANTSDLTLIQDPGANGRFSLGENWWSRVSCATSGTRTLPNAKEGTTLLVHCPNTSTVTLADSGGTVRAFTGTSGSTIARCTATDSNSWGVEIVTTGAGTVVMAAQVAIEDAGNFTADLSVEAALQTVMEETFVIRVPIASFLAADGTPLAKFADNASPN